MMNFVLSLSFDILVLFFFVSEQEQTKKEAKNSFLITNMTKTRYTTGRPYLVCAGCCGLQR